MALIAAAVGALSVVGGLFGSLQWDTPAGPSIVAAATVLFALSLAAGAVVRVVSPMIMKFRGIPTRIIARGTLPSQPDNRN